MNIFKRERKPDELVMKACNAFEELASAKSATVRPACLPFSLRPRPMSGTDRRAVAPQASENLSRYLKEMKVWLYGEPGEQSAKEDTIPVSSPRRGWWRLRPAACSACLPLVLWDAGAGDRSLQEQAPNVLLYEAGQY